MNFSPALHTQSPEAEHITICELEKAQFPQIAPLILELNPTMSEAEFTHYLTEMTAQSYRCAAVFEQNKIVAIAGFWIFSRFWCGKQCDIDNVIVSKPYRKKGYARQLMQFIEALAKNEGCETLVLDSYTTAENAHRFYFNLGYFIKGFHFIKPLKTKPLTGEAR